MNPARRTSGRIGLSSLLLSLALGVAVLGTAGCDNARPEPRTVAEPASSEAVKVAGAQRVLKDTPFERTWDKTMNRKAEQRLQPSAPGYAHARSRPIPMSAVSMADGFWLERRTGARAGIDAFLAWLDRDDQTAPFRAFAHFARSGDDAGIAPALETLRRNYETHPWRANTQTWLEACALWLQTGGDPSLRLLLDEFVAGVVAAHQNAAFLDIYYGDQYEYAYGLATPGHLVQAAIAHHRATGDASFLRCARQVADDILAKFQGSGRYAGHAGIEMALVELYRETGDTNYLGGARHFLEHWLRQRSVIGGGGGRYTDNAWHADAWCGRHVVRQPYLCAAGADCLIETDDAAFRDQALAIWEDMVGGKMQISGAIATSNMPVGAEQIVEESCDLGAGVTDLWHTESAVGQAAKEGHGDEDVAAARHAARHQLGFETCEAVGSLYWSWRMLLATGEACYADHFERVLYNAFLSHVSLDGTAFDYVSALASDGDAPPRTASAHPMTSCCPPNALRVIAAMPGFLFSTSDEGLWVHNYAACALDWVSPDGTPVRIVQKTRYPWQGVVRFEVTPQQPTVFDLRLRIPGWCRQARVMVNGNETDTASQGGVYSCLTRTWHPGDTVTLDLAMPALAWQADPRVTALQGRTAITRGPLVYCFEGVDNPGRDVVRLRLGASDEVRPTEPHAHGLYRPDAEVAGFEAVWEAHLLGGIVALHSRSGSGSAVTAIPYFAVRNRAETPMRVWIERDAERKGNHDAL